MRGATAGLGRGEPLLDLLGLEKLLGDVVQAAQVELAVDHLLQRRASHAVRSLLCAKPSWTREPSTLVGYRRCA